MLRTLLDYKDVALSYEDVLRNNEELGALVSAPSDIWEALAF